eukprot:SAG11_NODE_14723_length_602_cov_0.803181_1_plen_62_part_01
MVATVARRNQVRTSSSPRTLARARTRPFAAPRASQASTCHPPLNRAMRIVLESASQGERVSY